MKALLRDGHDGVRLLQLEEKNDIKGALDYMKLRFYQETWEMEQETTLSEGETFEYILSIFEENNGIHIKECDVVIY